MNADDAVTLTHEERLWIIYCLGFTCGAIPDKHIRGERLACDIEIRDKLFPEPEK